MSSTLLTAYRSNTGLSTRGNDGGSIVNLAASNNMFGSIAVGRFGWGMSGYDFVPDNKDGKEGIIRLDGNDDGPHWLGLDTPNMQFWAYNYCSPLASVIDKLAEADTNGKIVFKTDDGKPIKNPYKSPSIARIKRLLAKPNPWQTWEEFNSEQVLICKIFGYCPVFAIGPAGLDKTWTKALINLSPYIFRPQSNHDFSIIPDEELLGSDENPIKQWTGTILGKSYTIPAEDVMLLKDGHIGQVNVFGLPISKMAGLDYSVSNICAAMEADNVLLKKKGPLGVFSHEQRQDPAGGTPMLGQMKDDLQRDLLRYGLTAAQLQYVISKSPVKWLPMSFNVKDLMTKETIRQAIDGVCDRYSFPAELMSGKNATYENRSSAERYLYNNNIIPFSLRRMARYNDFFDLTHGIVIEMSYDHLPVLQEDVLKKSQAAAEESKALDIDWKNGIITYNEYRVSKGYEPKKGMDIFYNEYIKKFPPPKIKKDASKAIAA